jgi:hypothetical protein
MAQDGSGGGEPDAHGYSVFLEKCNPAGFQGEGGSYYAGELALTRANAAAVLRAIAADGATLDMADRLLPQVPLCHALDQPLPAIAIE